MLDAEPAFQHTSGKSARFLQPPYEAALHAVDDGHTRLSILAHGECIRTVDLPLTRDAMWLTWNGIVAIFEMPIS